MSGRDGPTGEPSENPRCPNGSRRPVNVELIEQPLTPFPRAEPRAPRIPSPDPDAHLVARWQEGDAGAFEALVLRHQGPVYRLLRRMLGSREEAEDVAQEAFLSLHRHGHRFRGDARFSTFVYRVAANAALNRRRSLGRRRARERQLAGHQAAGTDLPSTPRDPEDAASGAEVQVEVQRALLELPPDLRIASILYDIEGVPYAEVARVLGIPEGTVKSRIHRARKALRDLLQPFVGAEPRSEKP